MTFEKRECFYQLTRVTRPVRQVRCGTKQALTVTKTDKIGGCLYGVQDPPVTEHTFEICCVTFRYKTMLFEWSAPMVVDAGLLKLVNQNIKGMAFCGTQITNTFLPSTSEQQNIDHRQRYVIDQEKGVGHLKRKKMWGRVYGISFRGQIRVRSSLDDRITILKMNPSALGLCRCRQILIVSSKKCDALHLSLFLSWLVWRWREWMYKTTLWANRDMFALFCVQIAAIGAWVLL